MEASRRPLQKKEEKRFEKKSGSRASVVVDKVKLCVNTLSNRAIDRKLLLVSSYNILNCP